MSPVGRERRVPVIVGPTASGKTDLALQLALLLGGEIISADSRQVYKHLSIGTAKPTPHQLSVVPHHFVDIIGPGEDFNAGVFGDMGRKVIDEIFCRNRTPIVVGGSGLYVQSLVDGFFDGPGADPEYREHLTRRIQAHGVGNLITELERVDPSTAAVVEPTRPHRIIRALEVFYLTGKPISRLQKENRLVVNFRPLFHGLSWERAMLYQRINHRCESMVQNGLLEETEQALQLGYSPESNALNTVGYAETLAFLRGEIGQDEMMRLFKRNSRRYAKRQMTWFRRDKRIEWIQMKEGVSTTDTAQVIADRFRTT